MRRRPVSFRNPPRRRIFQYATPPVVVDGEALGIGEIDGFRARLKFFDYGVVSVALSRPFSGDWADLIAISQTYIENDALEERAEQACQKICGGLTAAFTEARRHSSPKITWYFP